MESLAGTRAETPLEWVEVEPMVQGDQGEEPTSLKNAGARLLLHPPVQGQARLHNCYLIAQRFPALILGSEMNL